MSQAIDFTVKAQVVRYVDTIVDEAGTRFGYTKLFESKNIDPDLRPYARLLALSSLQRIYGILKLFFTRTHAIEAQKALIKSEEYVSAAGVLQGRYHQQVQKLNSQTAKISENLFKLTRQVSEIDSMRVREARTYFACGCVGIIGAALFIIGSYVPAQWMKTAGKIILILTPLVLGVAWYLHRNDQRKISEAYLNIGQVGEKIRYDLRYYEEKMELILKTKEKYEPLFREFVVEYKPDLPSNLAGIEYRKDYIKEPAK
jgi:DNA repair ATPase RecN